MRRVASAMLIALTLFGCMVGPNYKRPSVDTPQTWRFENKEAKDVANTAWWEQFNDPVLTKLISTALSNNKDLKIAAFRVEEFMGRYAVARSSLFPQVIGGASVQRERTSALGQVPLPAGTPNPFNQYQVALSASWEVDLWCKLRRGTEAAIAFSKGGMVADTCS